MPNKALQSDRSTCQPKLLSQLRQPHQAAPERWRYFSAFASRFYGTSWDSSLWTLQLGTKAKHHRTGAGYGL